MLEKLSNYIVCDFLFKNEEIKGDEKEIMIFGVTRILEDIPKYIGIFLICLYFHLVKELMIVIFVNMVYKTFVGGAHARTNIVCFIVSTAMFLIPIILPKIFKFNNITMIILYLLDIITSLYIVLKIAPADTQEIPILNKKKRKLFKLLSFLIVLALILSTLFIIKKIYITQIILLTILLINLLATNFAYKMFKCKHSYESDEFKEYFTK